MAWIPNNFPLFKNFCVDFLTTMLKPGVYIRKYIHYEEKSTYNIIL